MTREELKKASERVGHWEYKYMPTKSKRIHSIKYPKQGHYRTMLGDSSVTSNVIGKNNDRLLRMFCYDAD